MTVMWGDVGCPRHDDGSAVITPRLRAGMTPLELSLYAGDSLAVYLTTRLYPEIQNDTYDSWGLEDFVSYGLMQRHRFGEGSPGATLHWCRQELWRRKRSAKRYLLRDSNPENLASLEKVSEEIPEDVVSWMNLHADPDVVDALVFVAEQGWTLDEVLQELDLNPRAVSYSLRRLRKAINEERKEAS